MEEGRGLWFSRRALTLHAIIIVIVPSFAALCIWQITRAFDGNSLSWAYVFEWPFFAGYAVYMWWRFLHEKPPATGSATSTANGPAAMATANDHASAVAENDPDATDRQAYNDYLAQLAAQDKPKTW